MDFRIGKNIKKLNNILDCKLNTALKKWNLTRSQFFIITYLMMNTDKDISQKDIEEAFQLKNPTVTGLVRLLEKKGFIERRVHPKDKRSNLLILTEKGRKLKPQVYGSVKRADEQILKGFSEEEKKQLENFLDRMIKNVTENSSS